MSQLKIITFNGNGLNSPVRRQKALVWGKKHKVDILFLQETHSSPSEESDWLRDWGGDIYMSHWSTNSKGVGIFIAPHINYDLISQFTDTDGRVIILEIAINERKITLCNTYGFNEDNPQFFANIIEKLAECNYENLIWGGDHNVVLNLDLDKKGGLYRTHENCKNLLNAWKDENEVDDVWRVQHPNTLRYTWRSRKIPIIQTRLDFFLTSRNITSRVTSSDILNGFSSDHSAPVVIIDVRKLDKGKGFWKLNAELLKDPIYKEKIKKCIIETKEDNKNTNEILLWDTVKCRIRGTTVKYSGEIKRNKTNKMQEIENLLTKAKENLELYSENTFPHVHKVMQQKIIALQSKMYEYISKETLGYIIRSRTKYYEEGEKNTKYFLALEKIRGDSKTIKTLITEDGSQVSDPKSILEEEKEFYSKLYTSHRSQLPDFEDKKWEFMEGLNIPQINQEEAESLEKPITEDEVLQAISLSADNKSPGTDGLGNEFYRAFWPDIKDLLTGSIQRSFMEGSLSISQRQGIISLIPKCGKDLNYLKNWRPISLLNQDYKIIARILAERCKQHLNKLISEDQNGFVPGRYIGLNINRILNLIELCKDNQINGVLLNIDFEKAFDCIEWDFIYSALESFGFPQIYISWVKTLYKNITACVINNGKFTCFFELKRGVRQGCPLSPYLFVLGAEILSIYIKQKSGIQGILHEGHNFLISQFADDTSLAIVGNAGNIHRCFNVLKEFEMVSGLKVNVNKTEALALGTFVNIRLDNLNINWVDISTRVLGIHISDDKTHLIDLNFKDLLEKIKTRLNGWKRRDLSILGKINIIKCLGISQVVYVLTMLPSPGGRFLKDLENILFEFIWNSGTDRIKRSTLVGKLDLGGINMIDVSNLNKSLKIGWVKRLATQYGTWCSSILKNLPLIPTEENIRYFLQGNLKSTDFNIWLKINASHIWYEIMTEWCQYNYKGIVLIVDRTEILSQTLWFNSHIRIAGQPVFYKTWYDSGIKYIYNLLDGCKWKTLNKLSRDHNVQIKLLDYLGILSSLPIEWRRIIKNENLVALDSYQHNITKLCSCDKINKIVYMELVQKICTIPTRRWEKWMEELGEDISELDWLDAFPRIHQCTTSTRLRSLGYRFLIRDVLTNTRLIHMGKVDTVSCYLCKSEDESITHLYWNCYATKRLWERLKLFIMEKASIQVKLDPLELILGISRKNPDEGTAEIVNLLCIIVKFFIHSCKCRNVFPSEDGLVARIKGTEAIERTIAEKKGRPAYLSHCRKWNWMCESQA